MADDGKFLERDIDVRDPASSRIRKSDKGLTGIESDSETYRAITSEYRIIFALFPIPILSLE